MCIFRTDGGDGSHNENIRHERHFYFEDHYHDDGDEDGDDEEWVSRVNRKK